MSKSNKQSKKDNTNTLDAIITNHVYWSVGAGFIPFPIADIAAVTAIQLDMLTQIADYHDINFSNSQGKSWIAALTTATASSFVARSLASFVKVIPVVGTTLGGMAMAITSGASTYALGKVFAQHFGAGGTLDDFSADNFKTLYDEMKAEGKEFAEDIASKLKQDKTEHETDSISNKLEELNTLLKDGLISKKKYKKLRKELFADFTK